MHGGALDSLISGHDEYLTLSLVGEEETVTVNYGAI